MAHYAHHWDTTGLGGGAYAVTAYGVYDGMATPVQTVHLMAAAGEEDLYLPYIANRAASMAQLPAP